MKQWLGVILWLVSGLAVAFPYLTEAAIPAVYTNANYATSQHDTPVSIYGDGQGGFYGYTATGKLYRQRVIADDRGVRLEEFSIDKAFFFITDRGTINAPDALTALSIYFTRT